MLVACHPKPLRLFPARPWLGFWPKARRARTSDVALRPERPFVPRTKEFLAALRCSIRLSAALWLLLLPSSPTSPTAGLAATTTDTAASPLPTAAASSSRNPLATASFPVAKSIEPGISAAARPRNLASEQADSPMADDEIEAHLTLSILR